MDDAQLEFLRKAHAGSRKLLQGETPTAAEHAALGQLLTRLSPVVKRLEAEQALVGSGGRFFR